MLEGTCRDRDVDAIAVAPVVEAWAGLYNAPMRGERSVGNAGEMRGGSGFR